LIISIMASSSISNFKGFIPKDFNFRLRYSSDFADPLIIFSSLIFFSLFFDSIISFNLVFLNAFDWKSKFMSKSDEFLALFIVKRISFLNYSFFFAQERSKLDHHFISTFQCWHSLSISRSTLDNLNVRLSPILASIFYLEPNWE